MAHAGWLLVLGIATCACEAVDTAEEPADGAVVDAAADGPDAAAPDAEAEAPDAAPRIEDAAPPEDALPPDAAPEPEPLDWDACDTRVWPDGYPTPLAGVECAQLDVPLDFAEPAGGTVRLRLARQRSRSFPTGQAIFQLAGGPGGNAVAQTGIIGRVLPDVRDRYDLVFVDQRGTGGSGYLDCPTGYPADRAGWVACARAHDDLPLEHYLTVDAAHDLDAVRRRLGYAQISLRGGSYGTRVALEYMRQFPERVANVVLDGVVGPDIDLFGESVGLADRGVAMLVEECGADPDCQAVTADLAADLEARRAQLRASPRSIVVGGQPYFEDEGLYVELIGYFVYEAGLRYRIPRAVRSSLDGDNGAWNRLMGDAFGVNVRDQLGDPPRDKRVGRRPALPPRFGLGPSYVAPGIFLAVTCAEWYPNSGGIAALEALTEEQSWVASATYVDLAVACEAWDLQPVAEALRAPVASDIPTLVLSGALDLNTPPEWADRAMQHLGAARHIIVPYATHSTMRVECAAEMMSAFFMADGDLEAVDDGCLARVSPPAW